VRDKTAPNVKRHQMFGITEFASASTSSDKRTEYGKHTKHTILNHHYVTLKYAIIMKTAKM